ncbi:conjugal transfer protein TrbH [Legionella sp. W05-934-2]|uniref:conjugal transfer protein TrbH n=1 Tax=Legionella sp. W05-934-2 TaxID=1198649 RepID=UPI003462DB95
MKKLMIMIIALMLSSCTTLQYGNFTPNQQSKDSYLAKDAVSQINCLYPAARNTFCLRQRVRDAFGIALIEGLRKKGYGIKENVCTRNKANFFYVVDETKPNKVYRVSLYIGSQTLTRAYSVNGKTPIPITPWSFKE